MTEPSKADAAPALRRRLRALPKPAPTAAYPGPAVVSIPGPRGGTLLFVYAGTCAGCSRPLYRCDEVPPSPEPEVAEAIAGIADHLAIPVEALCGHPGAALQVCPQCMTTPARAARIAARLRALSEQLHRREAEPLPGMP